MKFLSDPALPTPCYVVDVGRLRQNLAVLDRVQKEGGCNVLLALKGFAMWSVFPLVSDVLAGVTASSVHEARLGAEKFGKQVHAYAPAYSEREVRQLGTLCDHVVFNSVTQWQRHTPYLRSNFPHCSLGLRINPEHSEVKVALYDPCAPRSRLGVTLEQLSGAKLEGLDGLHFHTLCELGADALERTVAAVEERFGAYLPRLKWLNLGGGHHITRPDYDVDALVRIVRRLKQTYDVEVFLEPGEAIALDTGYLVASVLDVVDNRGPIAILDTSATAHMPDVLEMPYRPQIIGAGEPGSKPHDVRLGGLTCLAGDVIGDYAFDAPLRVGDRLAFTDMAHYTMVKNTTFNGVQLPAIAVYDPDTGDTRVVKKFGYEDYRDRLS